MFTIFTKLRENSPAQRTAYLLIVNQPLLEFAYSIHASTTFRIMFVLFRLTKIETTCIVQCTCLLFLEFLSAFVIIIIIIVIINSSGDNRISIHRTISVETIWQNKRIYFLLLVVIII